MSDMSRSPENGQVAFARERMLDVLVYHQRASSSHCTCGWSVLGQSHPEHVVDVYEQSVEASNV